MSVITMSDEDFKEYKRYWTSTIQDIHLPSDMNSSIGVSVLSSLDEVYAVLRIDYAELEAAKDRAESIIRQNERSKAIGKNEDDRKKNATEFLEEYPTAATPINMYEWNRLLQSRFSILKGFIDTINNKQQRLITMTGLIKIDSTLGSGIHS